VFRRGVRIGLVLALAPLLLSGCFINTPTNVVKRFVGMMKRLEWDKMEELIDWPSTERALQKHLKENRRAFILNLAECITGYNIEYYGEERARSNFSFTRVKKAEYLKRTDEMAQLKVTISLTREHSKTIEVTTVKVGRTWRIVITPNLLEEDFIRY
jgi:hypothetical protein